MKIGIITDVHSNIQALNVVLKEFDSKKVEKIICCGDIIGIGINPEETLQELIKRKENLISVLGNHEQYLLKGLPNRVHDDNRKLSDEESANHKWNHNMISTESKEFISKMKLNETVEIENNKIYITHYPLDKSGEYKKHLRNPNFEENVEMFENIDADIFLYGHTHTYNVNSKDGKWYINTGSVGCPCDSDLARAGILTIDNGNIDFEEITIKYDVNEIIEKIKELQFPGYKSILRIFYGNK